MEGTIKIEDYKIHCIIGAHSYEREIEQELSLQIEMKINMLECVQTDSIVDTVDYTKAALVCHDLVKERRYHLLETFAYEAVHALMSAFPLLWVKITVKKKNAIPTASAAVVEMELVKQ